MLTLKIAYRNIYRQKRRTFLTILTMFGGFALAAISIGWADGTYNNIINMFTRNRLGHIQIHREGYLDRPTLYKTITDYDKIGKTIDGIENVEAWTPRIFSAGLVSVGEKTTGVQIIGIDPAREDKTTNFNRKLTDGRSFSDTAAFETILGKGLAEILKTKVGDKAVIVSQGADGSIANDLYTIVGLIDCGDEIANQTSFYLHIDDTRELLVLYGQIHEIVIVVDHLDQVEEATEQLQATIDNPKLDIDPWQVVAKSFYQAMQADKQGSWISLFVIILIVAVGVLNTVLMTVLERTREYGVLRAIGTGPGQIFRLVVYEVGIMAVISIIVGAILALIGLYLLSIYGIPFPGDGFDYGGVKFTHAYGEINLMAFLAPTIAVLLSAMLVSIFPALRAARIAPARAMRTH